MQTHGGAAPTPRPEPREDGERGEKQRQDWNLGGRTPSWAGRSQEVPAVTAPHVDRTPRAGVSLSQDLSPLLAVGQKLFSTVRGGRDGLGGSHVPSNSNYRSAGKFGPGSGWEVRERPFR